MVWPDFISTCDGQQRSARVILEEIKTRAQNLGWALLFTAANRCVHDDNLHGAHSTTSDIDKFDDACDVLLKLQGNPVSEQTLTDEMNHGGGGGGAVHAVKSSHAEAKPGPKPKPKK